MIQHIEIKTSTLRRCCEIIGKRGALGVVDLASLADLGDTRVRKAITRGVELGFLTESSKPPRIGKGNRTKTWVRTDKPLPAIADAHEVEVEEVSYAPADFTPRRDWAVVALFGNYEARS